MSNKEFYFVSCAGWLPFHVLYNEEMLEGMGILKDFYHRKQRRQGIAQTRVRLELAVRASA